MINDWRCIFYNAAARICFYTIEGKMLGSGSKLSLLKALKGLAGVGVTAVSVITDYYCIKTFGIGCVNTDPEGLIGFYNPDGTSSAIVGQHFPGGDEPLVADPIEPFSAQEIFDWFNAFAE